MKTEKMYFTVRETQDEGHHVATIQANTDEELQSKLIEAFTSHFDQSVEIEDYPKISDLQYYEYKDILVNIKDDNYPCYCEIVRTCVY